MAKPVSNRVLKLNVGFLLSDGPGNNHTSDVDFPAVKISDDLTVNYIRGQLRMSRTKEGILVQAKLKTERDDECYRCLDPFMHEIDVKLEELFAYHSDADAEFSIGEDAMLDLAPLLRAEIMIEADYYKPCRPDAKGNCLLCGVDIHEKLQAEEEEYIDPRLAVLKKLLDSE